MSTAIVSWKTGTVHASVSRLAIVLRIDVSGHDLDLARRGLRSGAARAADLGALHVLRDDPPLGPGAAELREVDAALARDPAGERRRLDPAVRSRRRLAVGCSGLGAR